MSLVLRLKSGIRPCFCDEMGVVRPETCPCFFRKGDYLTAVYPCFCFKMGCMTPWRPLFFEKRWITKQKEVLFCDKKVGTGSFKNLEHACYKVSKMLKMTHLHRQMKTVAQ